MMLLLLSADPTNIFMIFIGCLISPVVSAQSLLLRGSLLPVQQPLRFLPDKETGRVTFQFNEYATGTIITSLTTNADTIIQVSAKKFVQQKGQGRMKPAHVMIFDSANPTGGDDDLGTPNQDFGGPGIGRAGEKGQRNPNNLPRGNLLIISQDDDSSEPNDNRKGGIMQFEFSPEVLANGLGLLDNEEGVKIQLILAGGGTTLLDVRGGGDNSYQDTDLGSQEISKMIVTFYGSGAITHLDISPVSTRGVGILLEEPAVAETGSTALPTVAPNVSPIRSPTGTISPTTAPTKVPTLATATTPTNVPVPKETTIKPTPIEMTDHPTMGRTLSPTIARTNSPTKGPNRLSLTMTDAPTLPPVTTAPTLAPVTTAPTLAPVITAPTLALVTNSPTLAPVTNGPTLAPVTAAPTLAPVPAPPTLAPVTKGPTLSPVSKLAPVTKGPTLAPGTNAPTLAPVSDAPTLGPVSDAPTIAPVTDPVMSNAPTLVPKTDFLRFTDSPARMFFDPAAEDFELFPTRSPSPTIFGTFSPTDEDSFMLG